MSSGYGVDGGAGGQLFVFIDCSIELESIDNSIHYYYQSILLFDIMLRMLCGGVV